MRLAQAVAAAPLRGAAVAMASAGVAMAWCHTAAAAAQGPAAAVAAVAPVPTSPLESAKRVAARAAVDEYVKSGMVVGVGSGSTIVYGIQRLAERYHFEGVDMVCVPTSFQSRQVSWFKFRAHRTLANYGPHSTIITLRHS